MIDMMPINSESISTIGYDEKNSSLHIKYKDNSLVEYYNIELDVFANLLFSPSKSTYIEEKIFNKFSYCKIN